MQDVKVEKVSNEDSLKVTQNDDGSFAIEWDPNDPRYSMFNDMSEEQISAMITHGLQQKIEEVLDD